MYDLVDRPVSALTVPARFILWAMRGWAQAAANGHCPPQALQRGFGGVEGQPALFDFHLAMNFFNRHAINRLMLAPLACTRVVEAEALLLTLWRDMALARSEQAGATISLLVEEDVRDDVCRAMSMAAARLALCGIDLSDMTVSEEGMAHDE